MRQAQHQCLFGFLGDNTLASLDPATGRIQKIGRPVAHGDLDVSSNHIALDDAAGIVYVGAPLCVHGHNHCYLAGN